MKHFAIIRHHSSYAGSYTDYLGRSLSPYLDGVFSFGPRPLASFFSQQQAESLADYYGGKIVLSDNPSPHFQQRRSTA